MTALGDRLALLLQDFRTWDPNEPCPETASELARRHSLELGTVLRIARSEGFDLETGEPAPLELTVSDIEVIDDSDPDSILKGSKIGRYEILEKLGEGGMGVVYVAYDPTLNRRIAIKVLRSNLSETGESPQASRGRILREAQAMAQVSNHPNIVPVYDVGTYGERIFIAMEYVEGRPINDFIEVKRLGWKEIRKLYLHAARGLIAAHNAGLVHRDFKPDNVLVDNHFHVKVMDFGLARLSGKSGMSVMEMVVDLDAVSLNSNLTMTGQIMGTPAYMAPEQFLLEEVDARADQFSFCVSIYEALTGYRPYQANSFKELALKVLNQRIVEPPRKSDVPEWVFDTIFKGLSTDKKERWASVKHLCDALVEEPPHVKRNAQKRFVRWLSIFVGTVMAALAVGVRTWIVEHDEPVNVVPATLTPVPKGVDVPYNAMTAEQVHTVVMGNTADVRRCYSELLRTNPELMGRVVVNFTLTSDGDVESAGITTNTFDDERIADCVMASTLFWQFPKSNTLSKVNVSYPFVLTPPRG